MYIIMNFLHDAIIILKLKNFIKKEQKTHCMYSALWTTSHVRFINYNSLLVSRI